MPIVFVSHSTEDRDFVKNDLVPMLQEQYLQAWIAENDIQTAAEWEREILQSLKSCDWFLVVMTPVAATSRWVRAELQWAVENRAHHLVPLLLKPCDPVDFHLVLATIQYVDFSGRISIEESRRKLLSCWSLPADRHSTSSSLVRRIIGPLSQTSVTFGTPREPRTGTVPEVSLNPVGGAISNSLLLDHSTLNSVARLLRNKTGEPRDTPDSKEYPEGKAYYHYVYDYGAAIDVASLGNLVEAILAHEKLYFLRMPGQQYRWEPFLLGQESPLRGILEPIPVSPEVLQDVFEQSAVELARWQETPNFEQLGDELLAMIGGVFDPRVFTPSPWADVAISLRDAEESDSFERFIERVRPMFSRLFSHMIGVHYHGFDNSFETFVRLIFTLCYRASMYKWLAYTTGLTYSPYAVRTPLVLHSLLYNPSALPIECARVAAQYVDRLRHQTLDPIEEVMGKTLVTYKFPVFLPYVVTRRHGAEGILETCVELRNDPSVLLFRRWVTESNAALAKKGLKPSVSLLNDMEKWCQATREELGLTTRHMTVCTTPKEDSGMPGTGSHLCLLREVAESVLAVDDARVWAALGLRGNPLHRSFQRSAVSDYDFH